MLAKSFSTSTNIFITKVFGKLNYFSNALSTNTSTFQNITSCYYNKIMYFSTLLLKYKYSALVWLKYFSGLVRYNFTWFSCIYLLWHVNPVINQAFLQLISVDFSIVLVLHFAESSQKPSVCLHTTVFYLTSHKG